jgi:hypothetical protein
MKNYYIEALVHTQYKPTKHKVGLVVEAENYATAMTLFQSNYERVFDDKIYCDFTKFYSFEHGME